jgi:putative ABC transport system permease protein
LGLALGITCFVLVMLYVSRELSYEKWNPNHSEIYKATYLYDNGEVWTTSPRVLAVESKEGLPEVEDAMVFQNYGQTGMLFHGDKSILKTIQKADPNFFEFFPYEFKYGTVEGALDKDNDIVISDEFALEMFGDINPVGELWKMDNKDPYRVTGVYITKDVISSAQPSILGRIHEFNERDKHWGNYNYQVYYKLNPGVDAVAFNEKFDNFFDEKKAQAWNTPLEDFLKEKEARMILENLGDLHLFSKEHQGTGANTVFILSLLAFLILIISGINFINLSISGAAQRAKEVAIRKTLGTPKTKVVKQFVYEVFLQCIVAILIAIALVEVLLPQFNTLMGTELSLFSPYNKWFLALGVVAILVLIAGIFPGLYLSNFNPVKVLKGDFGRSKSGKHLKKTMLIVQFGISAIFLIATFVIKSQLDYMNNRDLGFDKEQTLMFGIYKTQETWKKFDMYKQEIAAMEGVVSVSTTNRPPGTYSGNGSNSNCDYMDQSYQTDIHFVDKDYLAHMGVKLLEGKFHSRDKFSKGDHSRVVNTDGDTLFANQIVVNKKFVESFGFEEPIGKKVQFWEFQSEIIGVVDNYLAKGFDQAHIPNLFTVYNDSDDGWIKPQRVLVKVDGNDIEKTIAQIETFWTQKIEPGYPFEYEFLDANYARLYAKQDRLEKLVTTLSMIMVFISLLGLFAIASHTVKQRYKEVAIRKTLGATEKQLIQSLVKDFVVVAALALLIAIPVAFYLSYQWLQGFVFKIDMPVIPYIITPIIVVGLTLAIVYIQANKALKLDLVANLKYE